VCSCTRAGLDGLSSFHSGLAQVHVQVAQPRSDDEAAAVEAWRISRRRGGIDEQPIDDGNIAELILRG
jgi:hypothetical protein